MAQSSLKRGVIWLHKWLGVALALFFAMWFASGVVLYFVPFPAFTEAERLHGLPAWQAGPDCCLSAEAAAQGAGLALVQARLGMLADTPAWRVLARPQDQAAAALTWRVLHARTGALLPPLDADGAATLAEAFSTRTALAVAPVTRDQWTVPQGLNPYRPLYKVSLGPGAQGDDGLQLYVSAGAAEVVRDTRRAERFWNWLGAVPHWIYPTVLRQFPQAWHQVVVWLSVPAVLAALTGMVLGVWQLFLNRTRWIPYRPFWMRWHHILGLVAGVFTLTWMVSGLLSMNPFGVFDARVQDPVSSERWQGRPATLVISASQAMAISQAHGRHAADLDLVRVGGQTWYRLRNAREHWLIRADAPPGDGPQPHLPETLMRQTLANLRERHPTELAPLHAYDALYYTRRAEGGDTHGPRPLPVWRAAWADGVVVYADPVTGRILLRADPATPWQRLLYHGLHSLDFAPLLARPRWRDTLVIGLSVLGLAMSVTACVLAWRVFAPRRQRRARNTQRSTPGASRV